MRNIAPPKRFAFLLAVAMLAGCMQPKGLLIAPGTQAPALQAAEWVGGRPETAGKLVVVDVFATWCGPCAEKTPGLVKVYEEFHPQGVEFLALTSEELHDTPAVEEFVQHFGVPWPVGVAAGETIQQLGVKYIPTVIVIGPDGKVISVGDNEVQLRTTLGKTLAYSRNG